MSGMNGCCDGWYNEVVGECPDCGEPVDKDGEAATGCYYSPKTCKTCGARPCNGIC